MLGLGDRVKDKTRGGRRDTARVVRIVDNTATVEYDDGTQANVPIDKAQKTRR
jgi:hypothetical protein